MAHDVLFCDEEASYSFLSFAVGEIAD